MSIVVSRRSLILRTASAAIFGALGFGLGKPGCHKVGCGKSELLLESRFEWIEENVDFARRRAHEEGKPAILFFFATWSCADMELLRRVFPHPDVGTLIAKEFVAASIDCSDPDDKPATRQLMETYRMVGVPTIISLASDFHELSRLNEVVQVPRMLTFLREAKDRSDDRKRLAKRSAGRSLFEIP